MFKFLRKQKPVVGLESLVDANLITKEEMLLLKKERALNEYNNFIKPDKKKTK